MNNLYFACRTCKSYVDAGYRWAYWQLEEAGAVVRGQAVSAEVVLATAQYWDPGDEAVAQWLHDLLPQVRQYLTAHQTHELIFGEREDFLDYDDERSLEWINEAGFTVDLTPRYFAEMLGFTSWEQVKSHIATKVPPPWWYPELEEKAKAVFYRSITRRR